MKPDEMPRWYADEYGDRVFIDESDALSAIETARKEGYADGLRRGAELATSFTASTNHAARIAVAQMLKEAGALPTTPTGDENG